MLPRRAALEHECRAFVALAEIVVVGVTVPGSPDAVAEMRAHPVEFELRSGVARIARSQNSSCAALEYERSPFIDLARVEGTAPPEGDAYK